MTHETPDEVLSEREQVLLRVLVGSYIRDGQPVGRRGFNERVTLLNHPQQPAGGGRATLQDVGAPLSHGAAVSPAISVPAVAAPTIAVFVSATPPKSATIGRVRDVSPSTSKVFPMHTTVGSAMARWGGVVTLVWRAKAIS